MFKLMKINRFLMIFSFLALSLIMPKKLSSQIIEVGVTGGLSYYVGDINPKKHFAQSDLAIGGLVRYYDNLRWAFRFQYTNMALKSSDQAIGFKPQRNLAFDSKVNDFALIAEFNFFNYWTGSNQNYITPYIFAGLSVFTFETYAPDGTMLQPLRTEGVDYSRCSFSIPFGICTKRLRIISMIFTVYIRKLMKYKGIIIIQIQADYTNRECRGETEPHRSSDIIAIGTER